MENTMSSFWTAVDEVIARWELGKHPFYKDWMAGTLTKEDLCEYAMEYYVQIAAFPRYLRTFGNRLPVGELRKRVFENLCEELGLSYPRTAEHSDLWIQFAEGMGAQREVVLYRGASTATRQLTKFFEDIAVGGTRAEAMAGFYVYESQVAGLADPKASALKGFYGASDQTYEYFLVHRTADVRHACVWREELNKIINAAPGEEQPAVKAANSVAVLLWKVLDGINERRNAKCSHNATPES
jgi:pyrroloquinoline-quinone synthase